MEDEVPERLTERWPERPVTWRTGVLALVTAAGCLLSLRLLLPFLPALAWSVALAVALREPYRRLLRRVRQPEAAALLMTVLVVAAIATAPVLLGNRLVREVVRVAHLFETGDAQVWIATSLGRHPRADALVTQLTDTVDAHEAIGMAGRFAADGLRGALTISVRTLLEIAIGIFALFFLFRDSEAGQMLLLGLMPLKDEDGERVLGRIADAIGATIMGTLVIAAVQGLMGGTMLAILGVPNALFWAFVMTVIAALRLVGTVLVWAPAAAYLGLTGHWGKAAVLVFWGAVVISMIDNLLYPALVGRRLQLHTAVTFFAVIGGLATFGLCGVVLGPVLVVATEELLRTWKPRTITGVEQEAAQMRRAGKQGAAGEEAGADR